MDIVEMQCFWKATFIWLWALYSIINYCGFKYLSALRVWNTTSSNQPFEFQIPFLPLEVNLLLIFDFWSLIFLIFFTYIQPSNSRRYAIYMYTCTYVFMDVILLLLLVLIRFLHLHILYFFFIISFIFFGLNEHFCVIPSDIICIVLHYCLSQYCIQ